jgi:hypothetical protein
MLVCQSMCAGAVGVPLRWRWLGCAHCLCAVLWVVQDEHFIMLGGSRQNIKRREWGADLIASIIYSLRNVPAYQITG